MSYSAYFYVINIGEEVWVTPGKTFYEKSIFLDLDCSDSYALYNRGKKHRAT